MLPWPAGQNSGELYICGRGVSRLAIGFKLAVLHGIAVELMLFAGAMGTACSQRPFADLRIPSHVGDTSASYGGLRFPRFLGDRGFPAFSAIPLYIAGCFTEGSITIVKAGMLTILTYQQQAKSIDSATIIAATNNGKLSNPASGLKQYISIYPVAQLRMLPAIYFKNTMVKACAF